jgi:hypothetical protein
MQRESQRMRSFFSGNTFWPHPIENWLANPTTLSQAGFYFNPSPSDPNSDSCTCYLCGKSMDSWTSNDDPIKEHDSHCPHCPLAILRAKISTKKTLERARMETFGSWWPHEGVRGFSKGSSAMMAKAGFIYAPSQDSDDMVKCMDCGLALDGWEKTDDPKEEHYKRSPDCEALNGYKPKAAAKVGLFRFLLD